MKSKGVISFLLFTYALGYAAQFLGFKAGILRLDDTAGLFNYLALIGVMFIPALSAWLASRIEKSGDVTGGAYWPLPMKTALLWVLAMPAIFLLVHGITALVGASTLSATMGGLVPEINDALRSMGQPVMTDTTERVVLPIAALVAGAPIAMALGATLFTAIALGGEIGWRGYLLPRLASMGRFPAHVLTGLLWGLWFLPCLLAWLAATPHLQASTWVFLTQLLAMGVVLSVVLGEVWLRTRHMLLTALVLGSFLGQQLGFWSYLFENPHRPWAGGMGFIAVAVWLAIALAVAYTGRNVSHENVHASSEAKVGV